ncbi:MAG: competence protein CoiA [Actinobacteria bacterium]|nr:competence protein CoiA [Actinomycetota bacterium]
MRIAGTAEGVVRAARPGAEGMEEIRCPSCARLLVLRSGPAIRPHFAHRPRQSCNRRGRSPVTPLRLEQLTLFDLPPVLAPPGDPLLILEGARPPPSVPPRWRRGSGGDAPTGRGCPGSCGGSKAGPVPRSGAESLSRAGVLLGLHP